MMFNNFLLYPCNDANRSKYINLSLISHISRIVSIVNIILDINTWIKHTVNYKEI